MDDFRPLLALHSDCTKFAQLVRPDMLPFSQISSDLLYRIGGITGGVMGSSKVILCLVLLSLIVCWSPSAVSATVHGDDIDEHLKLATTALSEHRYAEAEQSFRLAIDSSPEVQSDSARLADLFNFLGVSLYCQQKHSEAVEAFRRALSGLPQGLTVNTRGKILSNLTLAYSAQGRRKEALQSCRLALDHFRLGKVDPLSHSVLLNAYGQLLIDEKNWDAAKSVLAKSLRLRSGINGDSQELAVPLLKLATVYQGIGRDDLAEELLMRRSQLIDGPVVVWFGPVAGRHNGGSIELAGNIRHRFP